MMVGHCGGTGGGREGERSMVRGKGGARDWGVRV